MDLQQRRCRKRRPKSRLASCLAGIVLILVSAACGSANDDVLTCTVRSVHDGDSMRVRCSARDHNLRLRLDQIDAPELEQAYGKTARDHLRRLCPRGHDVRIMVHGKDQYGRLLGEAECRGKDVSEELVSAGSAWAYKKHVRDPLLTRLEREARQARRGLWAHGNVEPPWQWRYRNRQGD